MEHVHDVSLQGVVLSIMVVSINGHHYEWSSVLVVISVSDHQYEW